MYNTRPSFATLTTKMFPQSLLLPFLLFCIFYYHCYAQVTEMSIVTNKTITTMSNSMIISTAMVCTMFSVLVVLVPTVLYYRYFSKEEDV